MNTLGMSALGMSSLGMSSLGMSSLFDEAPLGEGEAPAELFRDSFAALQEPRWIDEKHRSPPEMASIRFNLPAFLQI